MNRQPIKHIYGYIYFTICKSNNKYYIGQHAYPKPELDASYLGSGKALANAIRRYGKENFSVEILDWAESKEELDELEKYYIALFDAVESDRFYNIQAGGGSWEVGQLAGEKNPFYGRTHTKESIEKMKAHLPDTHGSNNPNYGNYWSHEQKERARQFALGRYSGENNPMYGKHPTEEVKQRISQLNTGRKHTEESKKLLSVKLKNYYSTHTSHLTGTHLSKATKEKLSERFSGENNPMYGNGYKVSGELNGMYGKRHTEEAKKKMREHHNDVKGKNNPTYGSKHPLSKQPVRLSLDFRVLTLYESMSEAERDGFYRDGVRRACLKGFGIYKGYRWSYQEDLNK